MKNFYVKFSKEIKKAQQYTNNLTMSLDTNPMIQFFMFLFSHYTFSYKFCFENTIFLIIVLIFMEVIKCKSWKNFMTFAGALFIIRKQLFDITYLWDNSGNFETTEKGRINKYNFPCLTLSQEESFTTHKDPEKLIFK